MRSMYSETLVLLLLAVSVKAGELRCLRPGAPVLSLYKDARYFPGHVESLGDSIDVTFDNGKQQSYSAYGNDVIVDDEPDVSELTGGSRVLARRPRSTSFEPGFVNGTVEGFPSNDTFLVNYDTGDTIARNIRDIRLATKPSSCMNERGIYIGCFENVLNNYLTNYYAINPTDVATCNWACYSRGFNFAGLQNGTWCFCGNHVNDSLKVDDSECNIACRDSREDVCGGYERMTIYWTGVEQASDNSTESGKAFEDAGTDKDLKLEQDTQDVQGSKTDNECSDVYDSTQCNAWAEDSGCIHNPDWMIANCKKSCYACAYGNHDGTDNKPYSSPPSDVSEVVDQTQSSSSSMYEPPSQPQSPAPYQETSTQSTDAQNYYPSSQDVATQASVKKSQHPTTDYGRSAGYLGCFKDSPSSHDLEYLAEIRPLSIRACITKCKSLRFPYAGVQASTSCYCGLHYGQYGQLAHEDCNTPCEADASEMCGGLFKNSLYNTGFSLKGKAAENAYTRNKLPSSAMFLKSSPSSGSLNRPPMSRSLFISPPSLPPAPGYQSPQLSYIQPSGPSYNPAVYSHASYTYSPPPRQAQTAYNQAAYSQVNRYPLAPASSLNNQAGNKFRQSPATPSTSQQTQTYNPRDSTAYRWRESYVKLRAQEQRQYSPISENTSQPRKRPTKSKKRKKLSWWEIPKKFLKDDNPSQRKPKEVSRKLQKSFPGNLNKKLNGSVGKSRYTSEVTQHKNSLKTKLSEKVSQVHSNFDKPSRFLKNVPAKKVAKSEKSFGKPGVFIRKKASKSNSFLAFLPREVTKDESLLEKVYYILSVMLKNLRKHKKERNSSGSMKKLKQYLKFPANEQMSVKVSRKAPKGAKNEENEPSISETRPTVATKTKSLKQKAEAKSSKLQGLGSRLDGHPSSARTGTVTHPSKGQKQPSKYLHSDNPTPPGNKSWSSQQMMYSSHEKAVKSSPGSLHSNSGMPSHVVKVSVRPESTDSHRAVTSSSSGISLHHSQLINSSGPKMHAENISRNSSSLASQSFSGNSKHPWNVSDSVNSRSSNRTSMDGQGMRQPDSYEDDAKNSWNSSHNNRPVSEDQKSNSVSYQNTLERLRGGSDQSLRRNSSSDHKTEVVLKGHGNHWTKFASNGTSSKSKSRKMKLSGSKNILKTDAPLEKDLSANGSDDIVVEKSDEDIISTIVQLLENEKLRKKERQRQAKLWRNKKILHDEDFSKRSFVISTKEPFPNSTKHYGGDSTKEQSHSKSLGVSWKEDDNLMEENYKERERERSPRDVHDGKYINR